MKHQYSEKGGCLLYVVTTLVVVLAIIGLLLYFVWRYAANTLIDNSELKPLTFPAIELSAEESEVLANKLGVFVNTVSNNESATPLALTARELNILIAQWGITKLNAEELQKGNTTPKKRVSPKSVSPDNTEIAPNITYDAKLFYLKIENNEILGEFSIPIEHLVSKKKYLNGSGRFQVTLNGGKLEAQLTTLLIRGKSASTEMINPFIDTAIKEYFSKEPALEKFFKKLERIEVKADKLYLIPKEKVAKR